MVITVITKMTVRPEKHREFVQTIVALLDASQERNGCLSRDFYRGTRNQDAFVLLEEWETWDDLDHHFRSDWFHILRGTRTLLREEPQMKFLVLAHTNSRLIRRLLDSDADL